MPTTATPDTDPINALEALAVDHLSLDILHTDIAPIRWSEGELLPNTSTQPR